MLLIIIFFQCSNKNRTIKNHHIPIRMSNVTFRRTNNVVITFYVKIYFIFDRDTLSSLNYVRINREKKEDERNLPLNKNNICV